MQVIDLSNLLIEFRSLKRSVQYIELLYDKNSFEFKSFIEYNNSKQFINNLENKISLQFSQINPELVSLNKSRTKRGLINGLGSLIKAVTGNLDANDAERYNKALESISSNQNKLKHIVENQITLIQKSIETFNNSVSTLARNQVSIKNRIDEMQKSIHKTEALMENFFLSQVLMSQITTSYQIIIEMLDNLVTAITFAKINILHNSIIESNDLLNELKSINQFVHKNQKLPFEPKLENILLYEKLITVKSFLKFDKVVFIIEIPLTEKENYDYLQLFPLPVKGKNTYTCILPHAKYLILNEHNYMFTNQHCKEILENEFICEINTPMEIENNSPCEVQLIQHHENVTNCLRIPVTFKNLKIQKLTKSKFLLIVPEQLVAVKTCNSERDHVPLHGTYMVNLIQGCQIKIQNTILSIYETSTVKVKVLSLPQLISNIPPIKSINSQPIILDAIQLDDLKSINTALAVQRNQIDNIDQSPIKFKTLSFWTILLYIGFIVLLCVLTLEFMKKRKLFCYKAENLGETSSSTRMEDFVV